MLVFFLSECSVFEGILVFIFAQSLELIFRNIFTWHSQALYGNNQQYLVDLDWPGFDISTKFNAYTQASYVILHFPINSVQCFCVRIPWTWSSTVNRIPCDFRPEKKSVPAHVTTRGGPIQIIIPYLGSYELRAGARASRWNVWAFLGHLDRRRVSTRQN